MTRMKWAACAATAVFLSFQGTLGLTVEEKEILSHMSIVYLEDGAGGRRKTIEISGINVQIVNGTGIDNSLNGLGNLIMGHDPLFGSTVKTGSHNVVFGVASTYTSHNALVGGLGNKSMAPYAVALGGISNSALASRSVVSGGSNRIASDPEDWVAGSLTEDF